MKPASLLAFPAVLFGLLLAFAGCDDAATSTPPTVAPPSDTTSRVDTASPVAPVLELSKTSTVWSGGSDPDTLTWRFPADSGRLHAILLDLPTTGKFLRILDSASGAEIFAKNEKPRGSGWTDSLLFPCTRTATYVLLLVTQGPDSVKARLDKVSSTVPYWHLPADAYEADDSRATARALPDDGSVQQRTIQMTYASGGNPDFIRIACDSGRTYALKLSYSGAVSVLVLSPDSIPVRRVTNQRYMGMTTDGVSNYEAELWFSAKATGNHHLRVLATFGSSRYSLSLTSTPGILGHRAPDAFESDDTRETARTIPADSTVQKRTFHAAADSSKDVDWIAFACDSAMEYTFHIQDEPEDAQAQFFGPDGKLVKTFESERTPAGGGARIRSQTFAPARTGTCHLKATTLGSSVDYNVALTRSKPSSWVAPDSFEADDDLASAKSIATDSTVQLRSLHGSTYYRGDVDYIAFDCEVGDQIIAYFTNSHVSLLRPDSTERSGFTTTWYDGLSAQHINSRGFIADVSGRHYARVVNGTSPTKYTIAITRSE